jgi:aspartate aminotransferase
LRAATGLLYGDTDAQRELALAAPDTLALPWIAAALDRIEDTLAGLAPRHCAARPASPGR